MNPGKMTSVMCSDSSPHQSGRCRIVYLVNVLGGGGSQRNVAIICKYIDTTRFEPEVWTLVPGGEYEEMLRTAGVKIRCLHRRRAYSASFAIWAALQIARSGADIIHAYLPTIGFYAALARVVWRAKQPMVYYEGNSRRAGGRCMLRLDRWTVHQFTNYMANSPASARLLASEGIDPAEICIIPNGHDLERWSRLPPREVVRSQMGVRPEETLAVYVGRLAAQKRVCDLVEAVARLDFSRWPLRVFIVGKGPLEAALKQQVREKGLEGVVGFLGSRSDVPELLQAADLFTYPSEYDGLANVVIEAALAGTPIVACDVPGVRDVVRAEEHALLVPARRPDRFAAAIREVLENAKQARRRAEAAQKYARETYGIDRSLKRLYEFYEEVLDAGRHARHDRRTT